MGIRVTWTVQREIVQAGKQKSSPFFREGAWLGKAGSRGKGGMGEGEGSVGAGRQATEGGVVPGGATIGPSVGTFTGGRACR